MIVIVVKKGQFGVVIMVVKPGQFRVVISMGKRDI